MRLGAHPCALQCSPGVAARLDPVAAGELGSVASLFGFAICIHTFPPAVNHFFPSSGQKPDLGFLAFGETESNIITIFTPPEK